MNSAGQLINRIAPKQRVLVFVMYKHQLEIAKAFLERKFRGNFLSRCHPNTVHY
jgi:hypothetical protein